MRTSLRVFAVAVLACTLAAPGATAARADLPSPHGPINDFADVLSAAEEELLGRLVAEVETATSIELALATVTSLDGLTIEDYATQLFAAWGVGRASKDNGVLILVAPTERAMRIEVGYGLEGVLPDGLAGQVMRETFLPAFRDGAFGRGIVAGTTRIADIVRRNEPVADAQRQALSAASGDAGANPALPFVLVAFLSVFVSIGFGLAGIGLGTRAVGPILFGCLFGGMPIAIVAFADVPSGQWFVVAAAVIAFVAGARWGRRPANRSAARGGAKKPSGWTWGAGGSSGRSGSSGSGGGSRSSGSFGGGRSGGGGATGRW